MRPAKLAQAAKYYRAHGRPDLADHLETQLTQAGRCRRCGRALSDPDSVAQGVGPDCAAQAATSGASE